MWLLRWLTWKLTRKAIAIVIVTEVKIVKWPKTAKEMKIIKGVKIVKVT